MYATNMLSTMALSAIGNLENHIVGSTSRMITECKKSYLRGQELTVSRFPENILLKIKQLQYCYELTGTK